MADLETLRSLQSRIQQATGPDRELDKAIAYALEWSFPGWLSFEEHKAKHGPDTAWVAHSNWINDGLTKGAQLPPWSASLDACVALLHEVLPGCEWGKQDGHFKVYGGFGYAWSCASVRFANDCLTFLDAICAAAIAEREAKQEKADV